MMQTSQREKFLIIVTSVVVFVVVSFFLWRSIIERWGALSRDHSTKKQDLVLVEATLAQKQEYETQYQELMTKMADQTGPSPVANVLQKVEQLAGDAGVTVRSRTPQQPKDRSGFVETPVDCSVDARIETLVKLLFSIRTAQDLLDVTELKITPTPADPAVLRADLRIVSLSLGAR
jgi:Tfp pilus assembly protein PilO